MPSIGKVRKRAELLRRSGAELALRLRNRLERGHRRFAGHVQQVLDRFVTDAARRRVDDARQIGVARRVDGQAQITEQIFDFGALEELHAADDLVRHVALAQGFFERARLGVHAVKNRDAVGGGAARKLALNAAQNVIGFFALVHHRAHEPALRSPSGASVQSSLGSRSFDGAITPSAALTMLAVER